MKKKYPIGAAPTYLPKLHSQIKKKTKNDSWDDLIPLYH